jgi:EAL domain-containing protein (putative c-di-GMP-specific phosphodiesterase class I)
VAEGVETAEQVEVVKRLGCDEMQGFYFSKPLPPEQLERYLRDASGVGKAS